MQTNLLGYFEDLYSRYVPLIYGLHLKYLQSAEKAENATLELFDLLLSNISGYEIKTFKPWLYNITKNHCMQILKKEERYILADSGTPTIESDHVLNLLKGNGQKDEIAALNRCIEKLPKQQKVSISMFFKERVSYADIAKQTGYLLQTVKNHIQAGKRNLEICIERNQNE